MKVFCIYDTVAKEGSSLFCAKNDAVAVRQYSLFLKTHKIDEPSELVLYCLGEYDEEQPVISGLLVPDMINTKDDDDE